MSHPKIRKAVFPVAGMGTRFLPATKASPKEMLPIVDKPLIQYAVEEAVAAGRTEHTFNQHNLELAFGGVLRHFRLSGSDLPDDDAALDIEDAVHAELAAAGFVRYETSAFAKQPAQRAAHNLNYWQFGDYVGIGAGAGAIGAGGGGGARPGGGDFRRVLRIPPDGGLISNLLLGAKNATKTAKIFLALRCAPPKLTIIIPADRRTPHRPHRSFSGFSGLISSPSGVS